MNAMPKLRELQLNFAAAIMDGVQEGFDRCILSNGLNGAGRMQVYRNNILLNLTGALKAVYPAIHRLVGDGFFRYAAAQYIARYPSRSGDLHQFGREFAEFLDAFTPAAELPYLPDVARLEWAYHSVFHAVRHAPLDLGMLAKVPPNKQEALHFQLHPAAYLLQSAFPILRIRQSNQDDSTEDSPVDLAEGGVKLLVFRREENLDIEFHLLGDGEFNFLYTLANDDSFSVACERALNAQPDFDIVACFSRHVLQGVLVSFHLE